MDDIDKPPREPPDILNTLAINGATCEPSVNGGWYYINVVMHTGGQRYTYNSHCALNPTNAQLFAIAADFDRWAREIKEN